MSLWGFRFLLWYVCILLVQPQNRFSFLWPLKIADIAFIAAVGLHVMGCLESRRPLLRLGPATVLGMALMFFGMLSQHFGMYQASSAWNPTIDLIFKNALLLIMVEAMATSVERVWAVQMTTLIATLWWIKAGLRLSFTGATYSADRLMGAAVSLIENPNGFAYMMCMVLPLYLYAYQQARRPWVKWLFLAGALSGVWIVFETGSRTGLVTLIVLGAFLLPHYAHRRWKTLGLIVTVLVLLYPLTGERNRQRFRTIPQAIASFLGREKEDRPGPMTQDEQSAQERKLKNRDTWALIKEYPVFGVGVRPDASQYVDRFPMAGGEVHCEILMAGRQMGMIGMGLYIGFISTILLCGGWVRRHARRWPALRDLGWTFQMQALVIAVGGSFCPQCWNPVTLMLAGSASALMGAVRSERAAGADAGGAP